MLHSTSSRFVAQTRTVYRGMRGPDGAQVMVLEGSEGHDLPTCNDVINHSPDGFEWGYFGSGPAQLALAMCMHALKGDRQRALKVYQTFKEKHIATKTDNRVWVMAQAEVVRAIEAIEKQQQNANTSSSLNA